MKERRESEATKERGEQNVQLTLHPQLEEEKKEMMKEKKRKKKEKRKAETERRETETACLLLRLLSTVNV